MNSLTLVLAILSVAALSALALSLFSLFHVRAMLRRSQQRCRDCRTEEKSGIEGVRTTVEALTTELRDLEHSQTVPPAAALPRAGLNLGKRSQALRMHRRGDSAAQIASALEIPMQEVELLLKVHRIVIGSI